LTDQGPTKDPKALRPAPSIVFLPASVGKGVRKVSGGKSVVQGWVDKFDADPLKEIFRGIIDRDVANAPTPRISVLSRYSIENYLLDPITVYAALLASGVAPSVQGVGVSQGNEHLIRSLPVAHIQSIADTITSAVETVEPALLAKSGPKRTATYTTGVTVKYPAWVFDHRGHDLLPIFQKAFGGPNVLTPPKLEIAIRRTRMIPDELASIMSSMQS
jgi:hypothetical protein